MSVCSKGQMEQHILQQKDETGKVNGKNDLLLITVGICGMKGVVMDLKTVYLVVCQSASVHVCSKNKSML